VVGGFITVENERQKSANLRWLTPKDKLVKNNITVYVLFVYVQLAVYLAPVSKAFRTTHIHTFFFPTFISFLIIL
jgi:hypothetical protein